MNNRHVPVITIDGPSGVGKGTLCQLLANHFGWHLLDSGAIYRVLALAAIKQSISLEDEERLASLALNLPLTFATENNKIAILLDGIDVSDEIRTEHVGAAASKVASLTQVRQSLLARQREFRQAPGLIADGRDMGTVVFQQAPVKIFLDASAEARAKRRYKQLQGKHNCVKFGEILEDITARDERDRNRSVAPLKPADDALTIDTTLLTIEEVFNKAIAYITSKLTV